MANNSRTSQPPTSQQSGGFQGTQGSSKQNIERKPNQVSDQVAQKAQSTFDNARTKVTEQFNAVARAIDSAASTLEQKDQTGLSKRVQLYAQKAEDASRYLENKSPRELKDDLDRFARQRPAWFLGGAFVAGLVAARFLKSSERGSQQKGAVEYATA
jgi:hypothetical protein